MPDQRQELAEAIASFDRDEQAESPRQLPERFVRYTNEYTATIFRGALDVVPGL